MAEKRLKLQPASTRFNNQEAADRLAESKVLNKLQLNEPRQKLEVALQQLLAQIIAFSSSDDPGEFRQRP